MSAVATPKLIKEYYSDNGLGQKEAAELGPEIERLAEANGGQATAMDMLRAAKDPASPFHKHLTWDNQYAADQWRLQECRLILDRVKVRYIEGEQVVSEGPIVLNVRLHGMTVPETENGNQYNLKPYVLVSVLRELPDEAERAVQDAVRAVKGYRRRLEMLQSVLAPRYPSMQKVLTALGEFERETA